MSEYPELWGFTAVSENCDYIAHVRQADKSEQLLADHLREVATLAKNFASKINASEAGELLGLLHDLGKFSKQFQDYIMSAEGLLNPDIDEDYVDSVSLKGKIDHSTAGAQWIWDRCQKFGNHGRLVGQILSLCLVSHHGGMIDCLKPNGENGFLNRINKSDEKTHRVECLQNMPQEMLCLLENKVNGNLIQTISKQLNDVVRKSPQDLQMFFLGQWLRMLFSCLIDADRINSADFEVPEQAHYRRGGLVEWSILAERIEYFIGDLKPEKSIDKIRRRISDACKNRSADSQGIYTLSVPTGGGKTYATLRYAIHHAQQHKLDRIIYIIPYTSIIDQNAEAIRDAIERADDLTPWVLEHHSNLEPDKVTWQSKIVSENWDAPIILTTMVQFLQVLFAGGTRDVRRMHQLARSILIFDEIQTLPIKCVHMFCNAINFLVDHCNTTAVLCTATQPLLNKLSEPDKGQLLIPPKNELVDDVPKLFEELRRYTISNKFQPGGWNADKIAALALQEYRIQESCLIITNTKAWAQTLYNILINEIGSDSVFHLSTNLCPLHRKTILLTIKQRLANKQPVLCVSTQLIEAGVDIDFASVIRFLAGLDSIVQAAGRCNRNGLRDTGTVHLINPDDECIESLDDIKIGRDKALQVLNEGFLDISAPDAIFRYFELYFFKRSDEMSYLTPDKQDNLLNLLNSNKNNIGRNRRPNLLKQSFKTAGSLFEVIDSPTQGVIVPYGDEGRALIADLCAVAKEFDVQKYRTLLKKAQQYSVNVFPNVWKKLEKVGAVQEIQQGAEIYFLNERYYHKDLGLTETETSMMTLNMV